MEPSLLSQGAGYLNLYLFFSSFFFIFYFFLFFYFYVCVCVYSEKIQNHSNNHQIYQNRNSCKNIIKFVFFFLEERQIIKLKEN